MIYGAVTTMPSSVHPSCMSARVNAYHPVPNMLCIIVINCWWKQGACARNEVERVRIQMQQEAQ